MFTLQNEQLTVLVLNPVSDRDRLGSRYCTGGYIWQITDNVKGDLMSGPQFPAPFPSRFDGQGAPEVFETALGHKSALVGQQVLVIGVGEVLRTSAVSPFHVRDNPEVVRFCDWEVECASSCVSMKTTQVFKEFSLLLERVVKVEDRSVYSFSSLKNTGYSPLPLRWFAHPFFPHGKKKKCCSFSTPVTFPDNPGFFLDKDTILTMHNDYSWSKGFYLPLEINRGEAVKIIQMHPVMNNVEVVCDFPLAWLPVWANSATFSFEPYIDNTIYPDQTTNWQIAYHFK